MIGIVIEHRAKDKEESKKLIGVIDLVHAAERKQPGSISSETMIDVTDLCHVVVMSSWKTLEDLNAWERSEVLRSFTPLLEKHLNGQRTTVKMTENVVWKYS